jgi:hypothetical protein
MTPDYDLSNLHTDQADLWFYLQVDAILAEILGDQPEGRTCPLALGGFAPRCSLDCACEGAGGIQRPKTGSGLIDVGLGNKGVN